MASSAEVGHTHAIFIVLWISSFHIYLLYSKCISNPAKENIKTCQDLSPGTCFAKHLHWRPSHRLGLEPAPELLQYPQAPNFTEDTHFCLVFRELEWDPTKPVTYFIKMGLYSCNLHVWHPSGTAQAEVEETEGYAEHGSDFITARFGLQLFGDYRQVNIYTTYGRLKHKSWSFTVSGAKQSFEGQISGRMRKCLEALVIEGLPKWPHMVTTTTDRCVLQQFRLSYPEECTSLKFTGGWKRGQTVTSATWSVSVFRHKRPGRCYDVGAAETYSVANEFTDRYINIEPRQLRHGMNRICNTFRFSTEFGPAENTQIYGPYHLKICGYIQVKTNPCIILEPDVAQSVKTRLPVDGVITYNARETIEDRADASQYSFQWSCVVVQTGVPCGLNGSLNDVQYMVEAQKTFLHKELNTTVVVTFMAGTVQESSSSQFRLLFIVPATSLLVNIRCLSNCHEHSISVLPVTLEVVCATCNDSVGLEYEWSMSDITDPQHPRQIVNDELRKLVQDGEVNEQVFSTTRAGNIFLERVFKVCINVTKDQATGDSCQTLNYTGAPLPFPGDLCIITPYDAELPGFLVWSYSGLCNWRGNEEGLRYKIFTYDVGLPEEERTYELLAFSDISRLPSLELPFGNPDHDFELGVVFQISNSVGQTYVFDVKEAYKKIDVVFKVRQPVDYNYLDKLEEITDNLMDPEKSGRFGSRQGIINVAGLVANIVDEDTKRAGAGLDKENRVKIRESLLTSMVPLTNSDTNTVLQLTPILDSLTKVEDELSDDVETSGAAVLEQLTEGLRAISATDTKVASKLSQTHYAMLERFSSRSVTRQVNAIEAKEEEKKKADCLAAGAFSNNFHVQFVNRANSYAKMFINIGASLVSSALQPDKPRVEVKKTSAIAVNWFKLNANTTLSTRKDRTDNSTFGSSVTIDAASLNVSVGTEINVIMAVAEQNLFMFGNGSHDVNMPMINLEIQDRETRKSVDTKGLIKPADIFVERTASEDAQKWLWEEVNITELEPPDGPTETRLLRMTLAQVQLNASATHALLVRFNMSIDIVSLNVSACFLYTNGSSRTVFPDTEYPRKSGLKTYMDVTQDPEVLFLPTVDVNDTDGSYQLLISPTSSVGRFNQSDAPYLMMLVAKITCLTWNATASAWEGRYCKATDISNFEVLHCQCKHLSIFSGGVLVAPAPINPLDVELFLEFFNNPAIVSVVVFIWFIYFILIYWAKEEDWLDTFRSRVAVLEDNESSDEWAYLVCCVTGWWVNSGTSAKVFMYIKGTKAMSRVHRLTDDEQQLFTKGAENWFILTTPTSLGKIKSVVVWHDASGAKPAWFLKEVLVQDINKGRIWHCLYNDWISVEHGSGDLCVEIPAMTPEEIHQHRLYQMVLKTSLTLRGGHIWLSILLKPCYSPFTRVQRLTCALCLLMTTMLSSLLFYGVPTTGQQVNKGPLRINLRSVVIGIECALVVFPINFLLVQFFSRTSRKPILRKYPCFELGETGEPTTSHISSVSGDVSEETQSDDNSKEESEEHHHVQAGKGKSSSGSQSDSRHVEYYEEDSEEDETSEEGDSNGSLRDESFVGMEAKSQEVMSTTFSTPSLTDHNVSAHAGNSERWKAETGQTSTVANDAYSQDCGMWGSQLSSPLNNPWILGQNIDQHLAETKPDTVGEDTDTKHSVANLDANNSAKTSRLIHRGRGLSAESGGLRSSGRMTERLSFITETSWFQTALQHLRKNVSRMVKERDQRSQDNKVQTSHPITRLTEKSRTQTSYFDILKDKCKNRLPPQRHSASLTTLNPCPAGGGDLPRHAYNDQTASPGFETYNKVSYFDKLKHRQHAQSQGDRQPESKMKSDGLADGGQRFRDSLSPHACWFCSNVPGQEQTIRHMQAVRNSNPCSESNSPGAEARRNTKGKLRATINKLRNKSPKDKQQSSNVSKRASDQEIPFHSIRRFHDYEYEQASKRGAQALRAFKRKAAQCFAEDFINRNRNASVQNAPAENTDAEGGETSPNKVVADTDVVVDIDDDSEETSSDVEGGVCCKSCTGCLGRVTATILCCLHCRCPRCFRLPWWSLYLTWVLAICVALGSSWVVMLYGLRLGYQGSVDWLSSFFTGWLQNVILMQPIKVIFISMLYIIVLKQHVNVREEAGVSVHDENNELLHVKILKEYEARKRLLDGMWVSMDYEYPIPRSKAKDIKLRLEQDAQARTILKESLLWAIFLAFVTIAALGHTKVEDAFATNTVIRRMLEEGPPDGVSFETIETGQRSDLWDYMSTTLVPSLYVNASNQTANNVSVLLGSVHMKQIRQHKDLCKFFLSNQLARKLVPDQCHPEFSIVFAETGSFNLSWRVSVEKEEVEDTTPFTQAWLYSSAFELEESPLWGQRAVYPGGGYKVDLPNESYGALQLLNRLRVANWMDRDTRAIVIRVNLYTPSKDLITLAILVAEFSPEGPIHMTLKLHTTKLHLYVPNEESVITLAESGWMLMTITNTIWEMQALIRVGAKEYLSCGWNYLELFSFFLSMSAVATHLSYIILVDRFLDKVAEVQNNSYVSFALLTDIDQALLVLKAFLLVVVVLKVFKVLRFNRYFRVLLQSFYIARASIFNQTLIAIVIFMAFASASYILFGSALMDYRSVSSTAMSLVSFGLGEGDFFGLQESQPFYGPIIYFLFIIFFSIMTLSFFVTFILESFNVSRVYVQLNAEEQHVLRYVRRIWRLLIGATPKIKEVRRRRRTHPFKAASFAEHKPSP